MKGGLQNPVVAEAWAVEFGPIFGEFQELGGQGIDFVNPGEQMHGWGGGSFEEVGIFAGTFCGVEELCVEGGEGVAESGDEGGGFGFAEFEFQAGEDFPDATQELIHMGLEFVAEARLGWIFGISRKGTGIVRQPEKDAGQLAQTDQDPLLDFLLRGKESRGPHDFQPAPGFSKAHRQGCAFGFCDFGAVNPLTQIREERLEVIAELPLGKQRPEKALPQCRKGQTEDSPDVAIQNGEQGQLALKIKTAQDHDKIQPETSCVSEPRQRGIQIPAQKKQDSEEKNIGRRIINQRGRNQKDQQA